MDEDTRRPPATKKRKMRALAGGLLAAGIPTNIGAQAGSSLIGSHLFENLHSGKWGPTVNDPEGLAKKLLTAGGRSKGDIRRFSFGTEPHKFGPHYSSPLFGAKGEHIQLPRDLASPMVVSHEVGHAAATNPFSKALRTARGLPGLGLLAPGLLIGGTLASDADAKELNLAQKAALPVSIARALAVQGEELRASLLGRKLLKQIGQKNPHFWKQLLTTQGTYALGNLASIAPILGGTFAVKKLLENRRQANNKTAAELADQVLAKV